MNENVNAESELPPGPKTFWEHVPSLETVEFHAHWEWTLRHAWRKAYEKLKEEPRVEDRLQTVEGVDVMPFLDKTLKELDEHHHKIFAHWRFQILGPTGGAQA